LAISLSSSVVVNDLNVVRVAVPPAEADPPSVVHSDAVLPGPIAAKSLEPVTGWDAEILQSNRRIQHP